MIVLGMITLLILMFAAIVFFLIPKIISGMVVFRSLNSYFEHKSINITIFICSLCVYFFCTLCFFYINFIVSVDLYSVFATSSLLLLEICFLKQKTTYRRISYYLFSAFPLSILIIIAVMFGDVMLGGTLRPKESFSPFIVFCLLILVICMMYFIDKMSSGPLKSVANVFILLILSALSVVAIVFLPVLIIFSD